jgi:hypothetical protein
MAKMMSRSDVEFELRVAVRCAAQTVESRHTSSSYDRFEAVACALVLVLGLSDYKGSIDVVLKMIEKEKEKP